MIHPQDVPFTDTLKIAADKGILVDALQCGWRRTRNSPGRPSPSSATGGTRRSRSRAGGADSTPGTTRSSRSRSGSTAPSKPSTAAGGSRRCGAIAPPWRRRRRRWPRTWRELFSARHQGGGSKVVTGEGDPSPTSSPPARSPARSRPRICRRSIRNSRWPISRAAKCRQARPSASAPGRFGRLVAKRDAMVAEERIKAPTGKDGFDRVVEDMLHSQLK